MNVIAVIVTTCGRIEVARDAFGEFVVAFLVGGRVVEAACDFLTLEAACAAGEQMARRAGVQGN